MIQRRNCFPLSDGYIRTCLEAKYIPFFTNKGETEINLVIKDKNKQAHYSLKENREFDINHLKALKAKKYVEKITV